jgi:hypothetical protein
MSSEFKKSSFPVATFIGSGTVGDFSRTKLARIETVGHSEGLTVRLRPAETDMVFEPVPTFYFERREDGWHVVLARFDGDADADLIIDIPDDAEAPTRVRKNVSDAPVEFLDE